MRSEFRSQMMSLGMDVLAEVRALKDEVLALKQAMRSKSRGEAGPALSEEDFGNVWASDTAEILATQEELMYESKESKEHDTLRKQHHDSLRLETLSLGHSRGTNDS